MKMHVQYEYSPGRNPIAVSPHYSRGCGWVLIDSEGSCQENVTISADIRRVDGGAVISATLCTEHFIEVVRNYRESL